MNLNTETKRKLREMAAGDLLTAFEAQDDVVSMSLSVEARIELAVDQAHGLFMNTKTHGLVRRAKLRYPNADLRTVDRVEERGLNQALLAQLATCHFIELNRNLVFQGFTGSGKSYLACAVAKQACTHRYRTGYVRMPDLEEEWQQADNKPLGVQKLLRKYANYSVLVLDEWLLDPPTGEFTRFIFELMERRYDAASTIFCTQYKQSDWHARLGADAMADAIMDRIVHNTTWVETGEFNMREAYSRAQH
ncbi:ATP-binding protein [Glutamicibacter soli]